MTAKRGDGQADKRILGYGLKNCAFRRGSCTIGTSAAEDQRSILRLYLFYLLLSHYNSAGSYIPGPSSDTCLSG
jgi:hypothetical protein